MKSSDNGVSMHLTKDQESNPAGITSLQQESAINARAREVFGNRERAEEWMRESNPALQDRKPLKAIKTQSGRRAVEQILGRIQHGVIS